MSNRANDILPDKIYLSDYNGHYESYMDALYTVFERDFVQSRPYFGSHRLGLKYNPEFQGRAYTFYHMTHTGEIENERIPDLRRCECIPWARPTIEKTSELSCRCWIQKRGRYYRVCIWLQTDEDNYFVILDVRKTFILPWTAFVAERSHEIHKKEKEYSKWLKQQHGKTYTPDELVEIIQESYL